MWSSRLRRVLRGAHPTPPNDPSELEASYAQQSEQLRRARLELAELTVARSRLEMQIRPLRAVAPALREKVAEEIEMLQRRADEIQLKEQQMGHACGELTSEISLLRSRISAIQTADVVDAASSRIAEALDTVSDQVAALAQSINASEDELEILKTRTAALQEMLAFSPKD